MHICFDNDRRLTRKQYLFEYKGVRFKLVQNNPKKWSDHLLTVLQDASESSRNAAFAAASEFLSALCWELKSRVVVWDCGGWSGRYVLGKARSRTFDFPRIPFGGNVIGHHLYTIPKIEHDYQRTALTLYREASAANNMYLSFLFYWQLLEARSTNAISYVDNVYRRKRDELRIAGRDIASLPIGTRTLGNYLNDDCRHAIAHIRRKPGKKVLEMDNTAERSRMLMSTRVIKVFAEHYIRNAIGLSDSLYLVRKSKNSFPVFADRDALARDHYRMAYK